jgi:WD40 repeat protein
VAFSPDGQTLATVSGDRAIRFWKAGGEPIGAPLWTREDCRCLAFFPDGKTIAAGFTSTLERRKVPTGEVVCAVKLPGKSAGVVSVACHRDGKTVLTAARTGPAASLWDLEKGSHLRNVPCSGRALAVAFGPDGKTVVTAGDDRTVRRWSTATGREVGKPMSHTGPIRAMARAATAGPCWWAASTGRPGFGRRPPASCWSNCPTAARSMRWR